MKKEKLELLYVEYANNTSAGTSIQKEMKRFAREMDGAAVRPEQVDSLVGVLKEHKKETIIANPRWDNMDVSLVSNRLATGTNIVYWVCIGNETLLKLRKVTYLISGAE